MSLKEARFQKRISQWALSFETKIPQSRISLIENGLKEPRSDEKFAIAKVLECEVGKIWPDEDKRSVTLSDLQNQVLKDVNI